MQTHENLSNVVNIETIKKKRMQPVDEYGEFDYEDYCDISSLIQRTAAITRIFKKNLEILKFRKESEKISSHFNVVFIKFLIK